eukprot:TRINITY_DN106418_c0_g1_i1.p1 TRINITY_DN106418_c0_g1~~TRINITY_DN106418_c0_g1_i1.p1  ORF type:complete len:252 (-),score=39.33 TRINITY_DN106418_c0_g1_i1:108-863(-)
MPGEIVPSHHEDGGSGAAIDTEQPFSAAHAQAETTETGSPRRTSGTLRGLVIFIGVIVAMWQSALVARYSKTFPSSLVTGEHVPLSSASCTELLWVTRTSACVLIFMILVDVTLTLLSITPSMERKMENCISLVQLLDAIGGMVKLYITIVGILAIAAVSRDEVDHCPDLYYCAWWCFVGLYLVSMALGCCLLVFVAGLAAGTITGHQAARESLPLHMGPAAYGTTSTQPQAQRPDATVQPFMGQGHRLSD